MAILGIITSAFLIASPIPADPAKAERELWQGTWKVSQMEIAAGRRTARLKFEDDDEAAFRVKSNTLEMVGLMFPYSTAKLCFDPSTDPKRVSFAFVDRTKKGPMADGTYTRDGDRIELEVAKWPSGRDGETVKMRFSLKRIP